MTLKQIKASKLVVANGGNVSKAMIEAGYSAETAHTPSKLTKSKAYQEIVVPKLKAAGVTLDRYISNVGEAMNATTKHRSYVKEVITEGNKTITKDKEVIDSEDIDITTRLAGNKQAEKLLRIDALVGVMDNADGLEPEDLQALASASDEIELTRVLFKKNK